MRQVLLVLLGLMVCSHLFGANFAVNTTNDIADNTPDGTCNSCSLREAIQEANALPGLDVITVPAGEYVLSIVGVDDTAAAGDLDINTAGGTLSIEGVNFKTTIVNANFTGRVFHVLGTGSAFIENFTIKNGSAGSEPGGGVRGSSSDLTLENCLITGNSAETGGGVQSSSGDLTITNCKISGNHANDSGGGVIMDGGTLTNVTVSGNTSEMAAGISSGGSTNLTNVIVSGNISSNAVGGILVGSNSSMTIQNSTISGNQAVSGVGGISSAGNTLTIQKTTIDGNTASAGPGGGLLISNGLVTIHNSTISNNRAATAGGGILNFSGAILTNCTISDNSATLSGGGLQNGLDDGISAPGGTFLNNVTVASNHSFRGGGILNVLGSISIRNSILADNIGTNGSQCSGSITSENFNLIESDANCTIGGNTTDNLMFVNALLGELQWNGGLTFTRVPSGGSPAIGAGDPVACSDQGGVPITEDQRGLARPQAGRCDIGAVEFRRALVVTKGNDTNDGNCNDDCSMREAIIAANSMPGVDRIIVPPGAYSLSLAGINEDASASGDLDITEELLITGNPGADIGGNNVDRVFDVRAGTTKISGLTIRTGFANGSNGGGALVNTATKLILADSKMTSNRAGNGGAIAVIEGGKLEVTNSTFSSNFATNLAGAIGTGGEVTITSSTLNNNFTNGNGGGLFNSVSGVMSLTNVTLDQNTGDFDLNGAGNGGGIFSDGEIEVLNCTISENKAFAGGGLFNGGGAFFKMKNTIVALSINGGNCNAAVNSLGHNLEDTNVCGFNGDGDQNTIDPQLGGLAGNGGPTSTRAISAGSPALDNGSNTGCPATDQRGILRPQKDTCDVGAFELVQLLFFDDFEDGDVSDWVLGNTWLSEAGNLVGKTSKKTDAIAPFAEGCSVCTFETDMMVQTAGGRLSMLGWFKDKQNLVEIILMPDKKRILVKHRVNGSVVAKGKILTTLNLNQFYHVEASYNGTQIIVTIDEALVLNLSTPSSPDGGVGFRMKSIIKAPVEGEVKEVSAL